MHSPPCTKFDWRSRTFLCKRKWSWAIETALIDLSFSLTTTLDRRHCPSCVAFIIPHFIDVCRVTMPLYFLSNSSLDLDASLYFFLPLLQRIPCRQLKVRPWAPQRWVTVEQLLVLFLIGSPVLQQRYWASSLSSPYSSLDVRLYWRVWQMTTEWDPTMKKQKTYAVFEVCGEIGQFIDS